MFIFMKILSSGYKVVLSTEPAYQNPSKTSYPYFIERMTRYNFFLFIQYIHKFITTKRLIGSDENES